MEQRHAGLNHVKARMIGGGDDNNWNKESSPEYRLWGMNSQWLHQDAARHFHHEDGAERAVQTLLVPTPYYLSTARRPGYRLIGHRDPSAALTGVPTMGNRVPQIPASRFRP